MRCFSKKTLPHSVVISIPREPTKFKLGLLGAAVFYRTYSRSKDGKPESWSDVVERVVDGVWNIYGWHMDIHNLPIQPIAGQSMEEFFCGFAKSMHKMEWIPPGRGLWMMGSPFVVERGSTALNNCAAVSTKDGLTDAAAWAMEALMNGAGVGFDTALHRGTSIPWSDISLRHFSEIDGMHDPIYDLLIDRFAANPPESYRSLIRDTLKGVDGFPRWIGDKVHVIEDSREGWVHSVKILLNSYLRELPEIDEEYEFFPRFDYSLIRPKGMPIRGFGGVASGPEPLIKLHKRLEIFLDAFFPGAHHLDKSFIDRYIPEASSRAPAQRKMGGYTEMVILTRLAKVDKGDAYKEAEAQYYEAARSFVRYYDSTRLVVDVFNAIGDCVVSGNVRRSSEIAIGDPSDSTFWSLKDYTRYPERMTIGYNSNNSVRFTSVDQYTRYLPDIAERIRVNGEPGVLFQLNIERYGRIAKRMVQSPREDEHDLATLSNPCGEICLESKEFCNLSEVCLDAFFIYEPLNPHFITTHGRLYSSLQEPYILRLLRSGEASISLRRFIESGLIPDDIRYRHVTEQVDGVVILNRLIIDTKSKADGPESMFTSRSDGSTLIVLVNAEASDAKLGRFEKIAKKTNFFSTMTQIEIPVDAISRAIVLDFESIEKRDAKIVDFDMSRFLQSIRYATFYCKCVSIVPSHSPETNTILARNRRLGVSLSGIALLYDALGATKMIEVFKLGYREVRRFDDELSKMLGVVSSIRVTTCKPSGSVSFLTGSTPGVHFPIVGQYAKRRVIIGDGLPIADVLKKIGVENEPSVYTPNSTCFTFYADFGNARPMTSVSLYEMMSLISTVQREWSDNMVSATVMFDADREGHQLEQAIALFAPTLKSCSFLPSQCHSYPQMPYEAITREEYLAGISRLTDPDADIGSMLMSHSTPEAPLYCDGDKCERH